MIRVLLRSAFPLCLALALHGGAATTARAHFKLLKPAADVTQDGLGYPQKNSPCGPGTEYANLSEGEPTGALTTYKAGETITVEWEETIAHPGYWRFAIAENRADLKPPTITEKQDGLCNFDEKKELPTKASGNVLADGALFRTREGFSDENGQKFSFEVTLPSEPCDKCTLQVVQVMENDLKGLSNCLYFHCADIRIVPADDSDAGSGTVTYIDGGVGPDTGDGDGDDRGDGDEAGDGDGDGDSHDHGDHENGSGTPPSAGASESSCAVDLPGSGETGGFLALGLLGLLGMAAAVRRSRRSRAQSQQ